VKAKECQYTVLGKRILELTGHSCKLVTTKVGEFAGWFLGNKGMFPDVLRYCAKFLGKKYRDQTHFEEARMSLKERCSAVKNQAQIYEGAAMINYEYSRIGVTFNQAISLFDFLVNSRNTKFEDLIPVDKPIDEVDC
jgi:hypothetical protein